MLDVDIQFTKFHYYWFRLQKRDKLEWGDIERHDHNFEDIEEQLQRSEKMNKFTVMSFTKSGYPTMDICSLYRTRLEDMRLGITFTGQFDQIFASYPKMGAFE